MAQLLTMITGTRYTRETINDYRNAYRMYRLLKHECGGQPPHLGISKLAKAHRSGPAHLTDNDKVKLCLRTAERGLTTSQMRDEALRLSTERTRAQLRYDVIPVVSAVEQIDALDLVRSCKPESVHLLHLDYQWPHGDYDTTRQLPSVFIHDDHVEHLVEVLRLGHGVLHPHGVLALYGDIHAERDDKLTRALKTFGFRRVDQLAWNKLCGAFAHGNGTLFAPAHEIIDFYRRTDVSEFPRMIKYQPSVTPKWHSRSHRSSAEPPVHPFEKPIELLKMIIGAVMVNGLIIDPFAGAGSCGVAAVEMGCSYQGSELVMEYVEIANRRIAFAADREAETIEAINAALEGANPEQEAAIAVYLEQAGIQLSKRRDQ